MLARLARAAGMAPEALLARPDIAAQSARLRGDAAAKRALWPRLRALRRDRVGVSAVQQGYATATATGLRPMREADLDAVMLIEQRAYPYPWTRGIFRDCLHAGYPMWLLERQGVIVGYGVLSIAAGEAHVLNLCTAPGNEGQGLGARMLQTLLKIARGNGAQRVFLEVRPSNPRRDRAVRAQRLQRDRPAAALLPGARRPRGCHRDGDGAARLSAAPPAAVACPANQ